MFVGFIVLGVQFVYEWKTQLIINIVATYITVLTGMLFLPLADELLEIIVWSLKV